MFTHYVYSAVIIKPGDAPTIKLLAGFNSQTDASTYMQKAASGYGTPAILLLAEGTIQEAITGIA